MTLTASRQSKTTTTFGSAGGVLRPSLVAELVVRRLGVPLFVVQSGPVGAVAAPVPRVTAFLPTISCHMAPPHWLLPCARISPLLANSRQPRVRQHTLPLGQWPPAELKVHPAHCLESNRRHSSLDGTGKPKVTRTSGCQCRCAQPCSLLARHWKRRTPARREHRHTPRLLV